MPVVTDKKSEIALRRWLRRRMAARDVADECAPRRCLVGGSPSHGNVGSLRSEVKRRNLWTRREGFYKSAGVSMIRTSKRTSEETRGVLAQSEVKVKIGDSDSGNARVKRQGCIQCMRKNEVVLANGEVRRDLDSNAPFHRVSLDLMSTFNHGVAFCKITHACETL